LCDFKEIREVLAHTTSAGAFHVGTIGNGCNNPIYISTTLSLLAYSPPHSDTNLNIEVLTFVAAFVTIAGTFTIIKEPTSVVPIYFRETLL
jgi:hypothetical protein